MKRALTLCTEYNLDEILQSGRVIHVCFSAPMGHGLSVSCPVSQSGFMQGQNNPNPIINPILNPIINPISPFSADF